MLQCLNKKQSGAVLVVSLIMLVLLTLIGLDSIQTTLLEEKMAYHFKDKGVSFHDAEAAMAKGEAKISGSYATLGALTYVYALDAAAIQAKLIASTTWEHDSSDSMCISESSPCPIPPNEEPRYLINKVNDDGSNNYVFNVYARGVGKSGKSIVLLKSFYNQTLTP